MATDEQLAQQLQQGDRGALNALVERHYDSLLGYLYRLTRGDRSLAQDLAQETFLRALRGISSYTFPRPFKPWLYAIATNLARNHYTSADQRRTDNAVEDAEYGADDAPDAALLERAEAQAVIAALDSLPSAQREVIVLYFYQSLSLQAIADTLDIPLGTVKSRLSIGVGRLRNIMTENA
ncbi:MAG: sigma-70 family RNA polymerase sigma factor [Chloroflexi bacterium]|nr:sigma-70 family RNA polymerase sigma factor [Chloroflexota bacterium]